jgi:aldose 1-epimerase
VKQAQGVSAQAGYSLKAGPFDAGILHADIYPHQGGRIGSFWLEQPDGTRVDALMPMDGATFDPFQWPKAGCYPLAPWSNLVRNSLFESGGHQVRLTPHPLVTPHALHGFSQMRIWQVESHSDTQLVMAYHHTPDATDQWPWAFVVRQTVSLGSDGLGVRISIENRSDEPMPAGLGQHPYFKLALGDRVQFDAASQWQPDGGGFVTDQQAFPAGQIHHDRRHEEQTATLHFSGYGGHLTITRADGMQISMSSSPEFGGLVFHIPQGGAYTCIEPVTHVVDAFNLHAQGVQDTGYHRLAPHETLSAGMTIQLQPKSG